MARSKRVVEPKSAVECAAADCSVEFTPKRSTAKYHSVTCRNRAARARRAAETAAAIDAKAETDRKAGDAEHGLVTATRRELERADALDTVDGQIALQLARKLTDPDHVSPGLAKELRATLAAAKGTAKPEPDPGDGSTEPGDDVPDEVKKARARRDAARQKAAGQA